MISHFMSHLYLCDAVHSALYTPYKQKAYKRDEEEKNVRQNHNYSL